MSCFDAPDSFSSFRNGLTSHRVAVAFSVAMIQSGMGTVRNPSGEVLEASIAACMANAERLTDQSYDLEFREPPALQLYVLLIAQEELAKAFLLLLVRDGIIPFTRPLLRAMNDHACKQLVGLIMDYIIMRWETVDEARELIRRDAELGHKLLPEVESAIMLLRFEKVGRWESKSWDWVEPQTYEHVAKQIADGRADRRKQDALYVRIGGDGRVCPPPAITETQIREEKERLGNFCYLLNALVEGRETTYRQNMVMTFIRTIFATSV